MSSWIYSTRLLKSGWVIFTFIACAFFSIEISSAQLPPRPVIDPARELNAIKAASVLDDNPADSVAVQQICTACHSSSQFLGTPRSSIRWEDLFGQMARQGAHPTEEQANQIVRYFQRNLTVLNANTSPLEELGSVLQTDDAATTAIVMRREKKKFTGIADLAAIPGVDRSVLELLKDRLQF